ncbi:TetR family transcriptional regulator C-terminal domain-containing protein [Mycobacteroides franklinii]|jgi:AcrR family transcriptional regulator|uniref:TetR family transcriptional regulator C-terminal domain-containing protein n=1 Tax=Mycobacteroides franklinii TaxID=948102 RepID=UPI0013E8BCF5|nr:hypothetical protein [Mycobacteroides franklinii]
MARPRKFVEEDVVAAARDQFWTAGYAGTSLDDLTDATGLGRGSLYGAFGDKHELFLQALDDYANRVMTDITADLRDSDASGYDRLVNHLHSSANVTTPVARRGCLMAKSAAELGASDKDVLRRARRSLQTYEAELKAAVQAAQLDGDLDPRADTDGLALLILTFLRGSEALRKAGFTTARMRTVTDQFIEMWPRPTK